MTRKTPESFDSAPTKMNDPHDEGCHVQIPKKPKPRKWPGDGGDGNDNFGIILMVVVFLLGAGYGLLESLW